MTTSRRRSVQHLGKLASGRRLAAAGSALAVLALAACGGSSTTTTTTTRAGKTTTAATLPGLGKPQVTIGDKNTDEQFVLGELYYEALKAEGFNVLINQNIGPTSVTMEAMKDGQLGMYPEYLNVWDSTVAGYTRDFKTRHSAFVAGQRYALTHGLELLNATPFSDTISVGVTDSYAEQNHLRTIGDLRRVASTMTVGAPPELQNNPDGLPALEHAYGFAPTAFRPLEIGQQYQALDQGTVQAAYVYTTDGQLTSGNYTLLTDPRRVFGIGNVVPVVTSQVLDAEGPAFVATVNRVTSLLTLSAIRAMNAAVDIAGQDPAGVARRFLEDHGVISPSS